MDCNNFPKDSTSSLKDFGNFLKDFNIFLKDFDDFPKGYGHFPFINLEKHGFGSEPYYNDDDFDDNDDDNDDGQVHLYKIAPYGKPIHNDIHRISRVFHKQKR